MGGSESGEKGAGWPTPGELGPLQLMQRPAWDDGIRHVWQTVVGSD